MDSHLRVAGAAPGAVYAAGDAATACAVAAEQPHWHQMRLWSQARLTGAFAALCMSGAAAADLELHSCFDLFTHSTAFFGQRVILLGCFNGQGLAELASHTVSYSRAEPPAADGSGGSYVSVLLVHGRMRGAVLIGEDACERSETYEHLILDELDLSCYGADLLDVDEDVWD